MIKNSFKHVDNMSLQTIDPANLPEERQMEDFWSILKVNVYENGWEAKTLPIEA